MIIISMPRRGGLVAATVAATMGIATVHAQQPSGPSNGPPNALQGFSQNRDKPIKINSATLEVRDKDKMATFAGDVHLVQGDTSMRSKTLVVFYDDDAPPKPGAPSTGTTQAASQNQQIKRVEAKGDVIVVQKDQKATGQSGIFDMRANTVTLVGNVVISQGPNVLTGETLTVDMTTGVSRITGGRVKGLFQPGSMKQEGRPQETAPAPAQAPRPRSSQHQSLSPQGLY
jgi:lipopolysaccharide export system protein LptA